MASRDDDRTRTEPRISGPPVSRSLSTPAAPRELEASGDQVTEESFLAVFSSQQRAGRWEPADEIQARAFFGEVTLDFTRAELPPSGEIEIEALALCGEVHIIVPDGAEVELDGTPVLGSVEQKLRKKGAGERVRNWVTGERDGDLPESVDPPFFRIDAHAILGSIKVTGR